MGKYTRKPKTSGHVSAINFSLPSSLGVCTRAKTLPLQRLQHDYLELRSRRTKQEFTCDKPRSKTLHSLGLLVGDEKNATACGDKHGRGFEIADSEIETSPGENVLDVEARATRIDEVWVNPCEGEQTLDPIFLIQIYRLRPSNHHPSFQIYHIQPRPITTQTPSGGQVTLFINGTSKIHPCRRKATITTLKNHYVHATPSQCEPPWPSWPGSYCDTNKSCCYPMTGKPPSDLGIHGLWLNFKDGTYPSNFDPSNEFVESKSYPYKILTRKKHKMATLRQTDGLCDLTKRSKSVCDCFGASHSSTTILAELGMAVGRDLKGKKNNVVAVIGDRATTTNNDNKQVSLCCSILLSSALIVSSTGEIFKLFMIVL